jgi:hypothetical protein
MFDNRYIYSSLNTIRNLNSIILSQFEIFWFWIIDHKSIMKKKSIGFTSKAYKKIYDESPLK